MLTIKTNVVLQVENLVITNMGPKKSNSIICIHIWLAIWKEMQIFSVLVIVKFHHTKLMTLMSQSNLMGKNKIKFIMIRIKSKIKIKRNRRIINIFTKTILGTYHLRGLPMKLFKSKTIINLHNYHWKNGFKVYVILKRLLF